MNFLNYVNNVLCIIFWYTASHRDSISCGGGFCIMLTQDDCVRIMREPLMGFNIFLFDFKIKIFYAQSKKNIHKILNIVM